MDQFAEAVGQFALQSVADFEGVLAVVFVRDQLDQEAAVSLLLADAPGVEEFVGKLACGAVRVAVDGGQDDDGDLHVERVAEMADASVLLRFVRLVDGVGGVGDEARVGDE